jgi:hypothetical protein
MQILHRRHDEWYSQINEMLQLREDQTEDLGDIVSAPFDGYVTALLQQRAQLDAQMKVLQEALAQK